ncbi:hypothetical protein J7J53_11995 [Lysobacter sp. ISL-52]|nr:hypothetical protein [Lysobacter sp. ISL-52]
MQRIMLRKQKFASLPLFHWLRSKELEPRRRLSFIPAMAHFIMSFGDINRYLLRYPVPQDELEAAINVHAEEDATHWPWYLQDLHLLDLDPVASKSAIVRELWSDNTAAARLLSYRLASLIQGSNALQRLALIEIMEETGNVMFSHLAPIARELTRREGVLLQFCGDTHLDREHGHAIGMDHRWMSAIELQDEERSRILQLVDEAADAFDAFAVELHNLALSGPPAQVGPCSDRRIAIDAISEASG